MIKIEKERKIKREYIPVYLSAVILILFVVLLVLTISYKAPVNEEKVGETNNVKNEELAITKTDSKCNQEQLKELLALANKISGSYRLTTKQIPFEEPDEGELMEGENTGTMNYTYIEISIKDIKEGVYVQISNNFNDEVKTVKHTDVDANGNYIYEAPNMEQTITYTIDVYADKYECAGEILRKVSFDTKIYNIYSTMLACVSYPKYKNCERLVDEKITFDEFSNGLEEYKKDNKKLESQAIANVFNAFYGENFVTPTDVENKKITEEKKEIKVVEFFKENKDLIIIACVIIGIGILIVALLMFIRRHKL